MRYFKLLLVTFAISGCAAGNTRENGFISVIDDDRMMNTVSKIMVESYLKASGCKRRFSKEIIGPITNDSKRPNKYISEHWIVKACDVTHNLKIDFYESGARVEATKYEP
jgi:hypothetical protein